ncbi:hypothetical protein [Nocardiopsis sp. FR6]|uniref:hypothetical protein n=1 Tax=Nocardiopsis sp. FR6 TaxID=2605986 RepID=UPI0013571C6E|nr:hypothetical protein [Nocardiopsis sp. FR6]
MIEHHNEQVGAREFLKRFGGGAHHGYIQINQSAQGDGMPKVPEKKCEGASTNCRLLRSLDTHHSALLEENGIVDGEAAAKAMAVGLVVEVWRNGPVENIHASRRGPSDAAMFAESTTLHARALDVIRAENKAIALLDFERVLRDRSRVWAGTGGKTLRDLGYGHLGAYDQHLKNRVDTLLALHDHTCVTDPWGVYLIRRAVTYGRNHLGMPNWPRIVERLRVLLEDPEHPAWCGDGRGEQAVSEMPKSTPHPEELTALLLTRPSILPVEVLEWLSDHFLFCAGPPYSPHGWEDG